ncbi:PREDICTED: disco-interacting protein 2 homolog B-like [Thamnophis sirtalis]|uniref:Disco-interacting protein 2 homolog B-like n=1 Tax=Thamnophis sirtalis TaxID=35019 RepID=A0A6I9X814_9SAUR|nr:PREDICTED: disco-interacting protein 2 homolog B-like [Thamnophis sirtalis]
MITPEHRSFLRFSHEGIHYQYRALPFGLASAPRTFTKERRNSIVQLVQEIRKTRSVSIALHSRLLGKLIFCIGIVPWACLYARELQCSYLHTRGTGRMMRASRSLPGEHVEVTPLENPTGGGGSVPGDSGTPRSRVAPSDHLALEREQLREAHFSTRVIRIIEASRRGSTIRIYNMSWAAFATWCWAAGIDLTLASVPQSVMNKLHTVSVPYAVMKTCPLSWAQRVHTHKAKVALVKCRDLHWAMMAHRDQRDVSLNSLRMLIVTDGANPWSVSSCDAFLSLFQNYGLKPEAICPCATSPEAMTVAIRRPGVPGAPLPGRAILSMNGLSYGVIRVNTEDKNSALTIQDVGHVMPGGMMCIVKPDGSPQLCKTDEIGEICVSARTGGMMYYGLSGVTKNTFEFWFSAYLPDTIWDKADHPVRQTEPIHTTSLLFLFRIAVFSVTVFYDERIVVVAEQRPDASEEDSFQWMSRVLQFFFFLQHQFLSEVLQWRAQATPEHMLFLLLNAKGAPVCTATCLQLHKRAERIASILYEKGHLNAGDNVVLLYPPGIELIAAFYGCLYAGCIPVTVRPPHAQNLTATLPTVRMIVDVSKAACILTNQILMRLLRSREAATAVDVKTWPTIIDTDDLPRKRLPQVYKPPTPEMLAYLDFSVSTTGMLTGVKMSHASVSALCRAIKLQCELYSTRQIAICLDPYCGLGFALWCLCSVYSGHQSILIPPMELESNLFLWLSTVSQYKIRDTFCSYSVMDMCTKGLGNQVEVLKCSLERHDALYVVGALDETLELRGLRYHPIDIETSISRMHRSIAECAVFTWTNLLVVVVELCGCEQEALDLVPLVTNVVLEEHYLIVGVVVVVDPGVIPINSRGEKQRMHLRDSFLADQLDPIYVAYNM